MPSRATIGAAGGMLASSDGRLVVTVPAGALSANTEVGIQPITPTAPGALGSAYRLTPEGQTFAQPVTLTFGYSAAEAGANAAPSLRIATRDARGLWSVANNATRDTAQRKVGITTTHFSDWSFVGGLQIAPASAAVALSKQLTLKIVDCGDAPDPATPTAAPVLRECRSLAVNTETEPWSVNGIVNGDSSVGKVNHALGLAVYTAPASLPAQNPVAVSTEVLEEVLPLPGTPRPRTLLVSNIKVVDLVQVYAGTFFGRVQIPGDGFHEVSANLRLTYEPRDADLAVGDKTYVGSGTAHVLARPIGCDAAATTVPVHLSTELKLLGANHGAPLAGTYQLTVAAIADRTYQCGTPRMPVQIAYPAAISPGGSDICPDLKVGDDPGRLVNSWFCNLAQGSTGRANWTLKAIE